MNSAIHIIRISGENCYEIVNKICDRKITKVGYSIQYANIVDNKKKIDNVLIMKFVSPKSFTGEDSVEINCHGGVFLANKIVGLLIKKGCKMAERGEFTKRSLLNKKININQAHAINNLINSNNETSISIANNGIDDKTYKNVKNIINELFMLLGQVEINIDYPEYDDVPNIDLKTFIKMLSRVHLELEKIVVLSKEAETINKGIKVAIVGKPNVGKSSLLNCLSKEEKSIVSNVPGTTRDIIQNSVNINDITFIFSDTAGIRTKTNNIIEKKGIALANKTIDDADIILFVYDASKTLDKTDLGIFDKIKNKNLVIVGNKKDKGIVENTFKKTIYTSSKNKDIKDLLRVLIKKVRKISFDSGNTLIIQNGKVIENISWCVDTIKECLNLLLKKSHIDVIVSKLHDVYDELLKNFGFNEHYDFIDDMFKNFCLGK